MNISRIKNFISILTAVVLIVLLIPAQETAAQTKVKLKNGDELPDYFCVGKTYTLKYYSPTIPVKFSSSNKKVAKINSSTGRLTPIAPGTVTITVRRTNKNLKKVATVTLTVIQRSTSISVENEVWLGPDDTFKLNTQLVPSTSSDYIHYKTSSGRIATVNRKGIITPESEGTAIITVYAKATSKSNNSDKDTKSVKVIVHIGSFPESAKPVSSYEVNVSFKCGSPSSDAADYSIVCPDTGKKYSIKSVTAGQDFARLTTDNPLPKESDFILTYQNSEEKTVSFTTKTSSEEPEITETPEPTAEPIVLPIPPTHSEAQIAPPSDIIPIVPVPEP